jgi:hypothetical protein
MQSFFIYYLTNILLNRIENYIFARFKKKETT